MTWILTAFAVASVVAAILGHWTLELRERRSFNKPLLLSRSSTTDPRPRRTAPRVLLREMAGASLLKP